MLAAHAPRKSKREKLKVRAAYSSASSIGIWRFYMSHLLPAITMGVSCGRYLRSSLIHTLTLLNESWSVMS